MIIITGTMDCQPDHVAEFVSAARDAMAETRKEAGCLAYSIVLEDEKAGRFLVVERWESEAAAQLHMTTPHFGRFMGIVSGFLTGANVSIFDVTGERPAGG